MKRLRAITNWVGKKRGLKLITSTTGNRTKQVYFQMCQLLLEKIEFFFELFFLVASIIVVSTSIYPSIYSMLLVTKLMRTFVVTYRLTMDLFRFLFIFWTLIIPKYWFLFRFSLNSFLTVTIHIVMNVCLFVFYLIFGNTIGKLLFDKKPIRCLSLLLLFIFLFFLFFFFCFFFCFLSLAHLWYNCLRLFGNKNLRFNNRSIG